MFYFQQMKRVAFYLNFPLYKVIQDFFVEIWGKITGEKLKDKIFNFIE